MDKEIYKNEVKNITEKVAKNIYKKVARNKNETVVKNISKNVVKNINKRWSHRPTAPFAPGQGLPYSRDDLFLCFFSEMFRSCFTFRECFTFRTLSENGFSECRCQTTI